MQGRPPGCFPETYDYSNTLRFLDIEHLIIALVELVIALQINVLQSLVSLLVSAFQFDTL